MARQVPNLRRPVHRGSVAMADTIKLEVARYSPERDAAPRFETFQVPLRKEWVVLDELNYIKDRLDGSLTFRWSCRIGICGSFGMMVDGSAMLDFVKSNAEFATSHDS